MRAFFPMDDEETSQLDHLDKQQGRALHQKGLEHSVVDKSWRWATAAELLPVLPVRDCEKDFFEPPDDQELLQWRKLGLLPTGQGGHPISLRKPHIWAVPNPNRDVSNLEAKTLRDVLFWNPNHDWVPRPLALGDKYFLVLFSGHRRCGDISCWFQWDGRITPIAVDLAVDPVEGDVAKNSLWRRLIQARKVVGGHGAPPCETYSAARWNQIDNVACPQPLRDSQQPWGRDGLAYNEIKQCYMGTSLMLTTLQLLLLIFLYGGSISLEHPSGSNRNERHWSIWASAFIKWWLLHAEVQAVSFLQGPLGQKFAKPTTLLVGRLEKMAERIFAAYNVAWRPTEILQGRSQGQWNTSKAKVYPTKLSMIIAQAHLDRFSQVATEGFESDPEGLQEALNALAQPFDAYSGKDTGGMKADYNPHKR